MRLVWRKSISFRCFLRGIYFRYLGFGEIFLTVTCIAPNSILEFSLFHRKTLCQRNVCVTVVNDCGLSNLLFITFCINEKDLCYFTPLRKMNSSEAMVN